jgi:glutamine amidotransferase PdxT
MLLVLNLFFWRGPVKAASVASMINMLFWLEEKFYILNIIFNHKTILLVKSWFHPFLTKEKLHWAILKRKKQSNLHNVTVNK